MEKFKTLISVIIIIFITILLCALTAVLVLRKQLTRKSITDLIMESDAKTITKVLETNSNPIITQTENLLKQVGFPEDTIEDLLDSNGTKSFLSIYATNSINYLLGLDDERPITNEDLKDLVDSNIDVLSKKLKGDEKKLFDEYSGTFYQYVDKHANELVKFLPTSKELLEQVKQDEVVVYKNITLKQVINFLKKINQPKLLNTIIFGIVVLLLLLFILNYKSFKWLKYSSIILTIYSSLLLLIELIIWLAKKLEMFDLFKSLESFVAFVVTKVANNLWIYFFVSIVINIVFIIVYQIIKKNILKEKPSE